MTTAQDVFDRAIHIMDEGNEQTGMTDTADTREYKNRTLSILNILIGELYPYSDTQQHSDKLIRPIVREIRSFNAMIDLDDYICRTILPYGLASHLLLDENPNLSAFFNERYTELFRRLMSSVPSISEDIVDVYGPNGGFSPYNEFSSWS